MSGHTALDRACLRIAGIDPADVQPRERAVPCQTCGTPTWNLSAACDRDYVRPAACAAATSPRGVGRSVGGSDPLPEAVDELAALRARRATRVEAS